MTVQSTNKYPNLAMPPFPVLRDLLAHVQLFLTEDSVPLPRTWDELITQAKQVNIDAAEPWLSLQYTPEDAWELVAGRIGNRAAAAASILCGGIDLIRPIDAEPQSVFINMSEDPGDLVGIDLEKACADTLLELRDIRHPAPPYAIEGLPSPRRSRLPRSHRSELGTSLPRRRLAGRIPGSQARPQPRRGHHRHHMATTAKHAS